MHNAKRILLSLLIMLGLQTANAQATDRYGVRPEKWQVIQKVVRLLNASAYDSAEVLIINELLNQQNELTAHEEYFFNSYEAEIMYYNALFEIGLASANKCLAIGQRLKNDTLIGSAQNLLGLQLMHLKEYPGAIRAFREAIRLLPPITNKDLFSQRYHALANLAEVYLYQKQADSTIYYSALAVKESMAQGVARGAAFSYWSWAEGELLLGNQAKAKQLAFKGLAWLANNEVSDANLFLNLTLMKIYFKEDKTDSLTLYQNQTEVFMETGELSASDFAKMAYLDFLIEFYTEQEQMQLAVATLGRARNLQGLVVQRQEQQRVQLLETFYNNRQAFVLSELTAQTQQREIRLKNLLNIFLASLLLVGGVLIYYAYRNIKQRQRIATLDQQNTFKDEQQRLELAALKAKFDAVDSERNRIAADLHDEIGAALSSIHIYSNVAKKKMSSNLDPSDIVAKIDAASAGLLDRMSDIIWSINSEHQTILDLKLRIRSFAADLLFPLGMHIAYHTNDDDDPIKISAIARKNIYLCFKELINNIAKHSQATEVELTILCFENILKCTIADNGQGFDTLKKGNGNGLHNVQRRVKQLGGEFSYSSEPGKGVVHTFSMSLTNISD